MNGIRWEVLPGVCLSLWVEGIERFRYVYSTGRKKPYIHPLRTSNGVSMTAFEPSDHVWHRGIWFSWKFLNGKNFWEERPDDSEEGLTELESAEPIQIDGERASVVTHLRYRPRDGDPWLLERRTVSVDLDDPDGGFWIDWESRFVAVVPVVVDRQPITEETPWGGYAGLGWRAARTLRRFRALSAEGRTDEETEHCPAAWVDLSGLADGGWNRSAGVMIMDHPENPRHPACWKVIRRDDFGYINPSPVMFEPLELKPEETLRFRYRLWVHDGQGTLETCSRQWERYRGGAAEGARGD